MQNSKPLDAIVVGAGIAGLYAVYRLRQMGLDFQAFDAASDVGGTWWWNCYPGARVDDIEVVGGSGVTPPLLDPLGDLIVHLMLPRTREFYGLERIWGVEVPKADVAESLNA